MAEKIKNYTSSVPIERTISYIEMELVKIGATRIEKSYTNGVPDGIIFSIHDQEIDLCFKLPANIEAALQILKDISEYKKKTKEWLIAQSRRTAWKIIYEWVQIQVAMVQLHQAEALQVFLPYAYNKDTKKTFYDKVKSSTDGYKLLT